MFTETFGRSMAAGAARLALSAIAAATMTTSAYADGALFTETNATGGNAVVAFDRASNGLLTEAGTYATGGHGNGAGPSNAGALAIDESGQWLLAVNEGSNDVSVFKVDGDRLTLTDRVASGGTEPVSVTESDGVVYVLNAGGVNNITGFNLTLGGQLRPMPHSTQLLSAASVGPAQVSFTPDGSGLVVTEKGTSLIDTFLVDDYGYASSGIWNPSSGSTPFGFAFDATGDLYVSEAGPNAVSSYWIGIDGKLHTISATVLDNQLGVCWVALSQQHGHLWASDAHNGMISAYSATPLGKLILEPNNGGVAASTQGGGPTDIGVSPNGKFVFEVNGGLGEIQAFSVGSEGSLTLIGVGAGIGSSPTGLVVH